MKIGIMADSHDHLGRIEKAVELLASSGAEVLLHAGDFIAPFAVKEILKFPGEAYGVFGNNDGEIAGIKKLWRHVYFGPYLFELGNRRILVCHDEREMSRAPYKDIDVRIFAHSHKPEIRRGPPLEINPGTAAGILTGRSTCAILDTDALTAELLEIE